MINWVNSWKSKKKELYRFELRLGTLTLLEIKFSTCKTKTCPKVRFIIFNVGFEI
tara:strand:- start:232 stop:396 length:165 start_codon:yes stop_codon:yes gene_type:complete